MSHGSSEPARAPARARIAVLSEHVKNQIAAGEVIERPASVVKELIENALDAGATNIAIDLEEGGTRLVRVSDDGCGMGREDLALAFVAHATSKLFETADLEHIASLGFRGEALASMGAVARCRITTRRAEDATGWRIDDEGGALSAVGEAGAPRGTSIEVRELFYNVPARRRFLKRTATELSHCLDVIQRAALAHDGVGFVATHDGRRLYDVEAAMDFRGRIRRSFGAELAQALAAVDARDGDLVLSGFVAPPRFARADTTRQMWFLNGRSLKDRVLLRALKEGYRGLMFDNRQPVAFLRLSIDPARVDVNVHPAKAEVRFRDERSMFGFIVNALRAGLHASDLAMSGASLLETAARRELREARAPGANWAVGPLDVARVREAPSVFELTPHVPLAAPTHAQLARETPAVPVPQAGVARTSAGLVQVARTYIVRALEEGFEIIDQHALHERITFEGLVHDLRQGRTEIQHLLVPELVEVSRAEAALVAEHAALFARIGIELELFGPTTVAVRGWPARLARPDARGIVNDVLASLESARPARVEDVLEAVLHRAACRSSVMAGDALSQAEMQALIERGAALESDQTCVHGRPTRVRFTLADLEKVFQRR